MTQFTMCEKYFKIYDNGGYKYLIPKDVEEFLSRGKVVTGIQDHGRSDMPWIFTSVGDGSDSHSALLVGITEIKKDSAESLIKDLARFAESEATIKEWQTLIDRARKLIERGGK